MDTPKLMLMHLKHATIWLSCAIAISILLTILRTIQVVPFVLVVVAIGGIIPSIVVLLWGTIKFRSYYEINRSKKDLFDMGLVTLIQLVSLATGAYLFVSLLNIFDGIKI